MYWYENYSPGRLSSTALAVLLAAYLFGYMGAPPMGPVGAFFISITALYFTWVWFGPLLDEYLIFPKKRLLLHSLREASAFSDDLRRLLVKRKKKLGEEGREALNSSINKLDKAIASRDTAKLSLALQHADKVATAQLGSGKRGVVREFFESIGGALLVALLLRVFVIEAFKIPSGSMIPTLEIGDHIFVNKFAYGLGIPSPHGQIRLLDFDPPKAGDVIVFVAPKPADDAGEDFIKRVVAVAGQKVSMRDGSVYVDGKIQPRDNPRPYRYEEYISELGVVQSLHATRYHERTNETDHDILLTYFAGNSWPKAGHRGQGLHCEAGACEVLPGYIFCMGDNRDNSSDSRFWGAVPVQNVRGKAMFVWMSFANAPDEGGALGVRWSRIGTALH